VKQSTVQIEPDYVSRGLFLHATDTEWTPSPLVTLRDAADEIAPWVKAHPKFPQDRFERELLIRCPWPWRWRDLRIDASTPGNRALSKVLQWFAGHPFPQEIFDWTAEAALHTVAYALIYKQPVDEWAYSPEFRIWPTFRPKFADKWNVAEDRAVFRNRVEQRFQAQLDEYCDRIERMHASRKRDAEDHAVQVARRLNGWTWKEIRDHGYRGMSEDLVRKNACAFADRLGINLSAVTLADSLASRDQKTTTKERQRSQR
jgi:hypothetical protein